MTSIRRQFAGQVLIVLGIIAISCLAGAELIEPSRSLDAASNESGRIWVFSEPPGLSVLIDGKNAGVTPIVGIEIGAGGHLVQVQNNSTEVLVSPGKPVRLSFFKGQFLMLPEEEKVMSGAASPKPSTPSAPARTDSKPVQADKTNDFYWPINPRGPIY